MIDRAGSRTSRGSEDAARRLSGYPRDQERAEMWITAPLAVGQERGLSHADLRGTASKVRSSSLEMVRNKSIVYKSLRNHFSSFSKSVLIEAEAESALREPRLDPQLFAGSATDSPRGEVDRGHSGSR